MSSETPILGIPEMDPAQSQPHVIVNSAIRALEVFGQITAVSKADPTDSPFTPADGDVYIVPVGTGIPEWVLYENAVAYYASGWYFLTPRAGWVAYVSDEDAYYRFSADSPGVWELFTLGAGTVDAYDVDYASTASPGPTSGIDKVGDALDELYGLVADAEAGLVGDAYDLQYTSTDSPGPGIGVDNVGEALDEVYELIETINDLGIAASLTALKSFALPLSISGKPGAAAIWHIMTPIAFRLPASLTGSYGYSGTNATATATFTLKRLGASIGTIEFGSGSATPTFTFTNPVDFAAGDRFTIEAPSSQDATLANVSISLKATRI